MSLVNVKAALSEDYRFIRASRRTWGLRAWGDSLSTPELRTIGARIDAGGGTAKVNDLIVDLLAAYPDVAESSVRSHICRLSSSSQRQEWCGDAPRRRSGHIGPAAECGAGSIP